MHGKSRWLAATVVVLLVAAVPAVALGQGRHAHVHEPARHPHAAAGRVARRHVAGRRLIFDVLNTRKGLMMQAIDVEIDATCGDNSVGFFVSGFKRAIKPNGNF